MTGLFGIAISSASPSELHHLRGKGLGYVDLGRTHGHGIPAQRRRKPYSRSVISQSANRAICEWDAERAGKGGLVPEGEGNQGKGTGWCWRELRITNLSTNACHERRKRCHHTTTTVCLRLPHPSYGTNAWPSSNWWRIASITVC